MPEKNYRASTGVDEFYHGVIGDGMVAEEINRTKFLQNITVDMPQTPVRAHGDNKTAEIAVASGNISVTSGFHVIPIEDKAVLLGWETKDGITSAGSADNPPYVGVIFAKTYEDGSRKYVGLAKGIFLRPNVTGNSKTDSVEFSNEEIAAEFMDREIEGYDEEKSVLFARDEKGETENRDKLFQLVFGKPHPNTDDEEPEGA